MAQGSGLSIDPSSSHHHHPLHLFTSSDHTQDLSLRHRHKFKLEPLRSQPMDSREGLNVFSSIPPPPPPPPPATIQFPVNLNCTTTNHEHDQEDEDDGYFKSDEKRPVIDEMDFFASKKDDEDHNIAETDGDDQKDALCGPQHFNVNVSLVFLFLSYLYFSTTFIVFLINYFYSLLAIDISALTNYKLLILNRLVCIFSPQTLAVISQ